MVRELGSVVVAAVPEQELNVAVMLWLRAFVVLVTYAFALVGAHVEFAQESA